MPNVYNSATTWQDLYALSGIAPGTAVNVQNQGGSTLQLRQNTVDPTGRVVITYASQDCTGSTVLQGRSNGGLSIFIQELE